MQSVSNSFEGGTWGCEKIWGGGPLFSCLIAFLWSNFSKSFEGVHEEHPLFKTKNCIQMKNKNIADYISSKLNWKPKRVCTCKSGSFWSRWLAHLMSPDFQGHSLTLEILSLPIPWPEHTQRNRLPTSSSLVLGRVIVTGSSPVHQGSLFKNHFKEDLLSKTFNDTEE